MKFFPKKRKLTPDEEIKHLMDELNFLINESYERFKELKSSQASNNYHYSLQLIGEEDKLYPSPEGVIRMAVHEYRNNPTRSDCDMVAYIIETLRMIMRSNGYRISVTEDGKFLAFDVGKDAENNGGEPDKNHPQPNEDGGWA